MSCFRLTYAHKIVIRNSYLEIVISKVRHQDPLCNTRNLTPHYIITYIEKEPPKKRMHLYGSEPVAVD